jgi:hypothetical protein
MRTTKTKSLLDRSAKEDLWQKTLLQIPTLAGRLVYSSQLRDATTGKYHHHGLEVIYGEEEAQKALRQSHKQLFTEWLALGLEAKSKDLEVYLLSLQQPIVTVLSLWERLESWKGWVPYSYSTPERAHFKSDLEVVMRVIKLKYGVAVQRQGA